MSKDVGWKCRLWKYPLFTILDSPSVNITLERNLSLFSRMKKFIFCTRFFVLRPHHFVIFRLHIRESGFSCLLHTGIIPFISGLVYSRMKLLCCTVTNILSWHAFPLHWISHGLYISLIFVKHLININLKPLPCLNFVVFYERSLTRRSDTISENSWSHTFTSKTISLDITVYFRLESKSVISVEPPAFFVFCFLVPDIFKYTVWNCFYKTFNHFAHFTESH